MITEKERRLRVITIRNRLHEIRKAAKRPLESRKLAHTIHNRHPEIPIQAVYGTMAYLTRTNVIRWVIKHKGGRSYFI